MPPRVIAREVVDFKIIDIDPKDVAAALQPYVARGSKGVSIDDIDVTVKSIPQGSPPGLAALLEAGMKLFDAIVWLPGGGAAAKALTVDSNIDPKTIPSLHTVTRSVFYTYFFLLTQARYPAPADEVNSLKVMMFLIKVMSMSESQHVYIWNICSFTPSKFDPKWIRKVKYNGLDQEVLWKFGLGVAEYHLFSPFKILTPTKPLSPEVRAA
ncbi:hypothetical protein MMC12_008106 [Toensbergia leucococca]|nr:hypothetical protein [Toensbergia leucococca]